MDNHIINMISTLGKLRLIKKGYSTNRAGRPLRNSEDLMWDFASIDCKVGKVLEGIDANRQAKKIRGTGEEA